MPNTSRLTVAIEGPVCAGKTTLSDNLTIEYGQSKLCVIPDYSDFAGGGKNLPNALPNTVEEEIDALKEFVRLEGERFRDYSRQTELCVIDRSAHTLLAHCVGIASHCGRDWLDTAQELLGQAPEVVWPELIVYLDVPHATIVDRNRGKFPAGSLFTDVQFNIGFHDYFIPKLRFGEVRIIRLDGTVPPDQVCLGACEAIGCVR